MRAVVAIVASSSSYGLVFRRELPSSDAPRVPDVEVPEDDALAGAGHAAGAAADALPAGLDSPSSTPCSWPGPSSRRTIPALFLGGFLIFLASSAPRRRTKAASS